MPIESVYFPTNRNVFFDSTYTAEYLTTHRDFFLSARGTVFFCFFFFLCPGAVGESVEEDVL
jgi:hypothetical protein